MQSYKNIFYKKNGERNKSDNYTKFSGTTESYAS